MMQFHVSSRTLLTGSLTAVMLLGHGCAHYCAGTPNAQSTSPSSASSTSEAAVWQCIVNERLHIRRTVKHTSSGIETLTESDDAQVSQMLIAQGTQLQSRLAGGGVLRPWDPSFVDRYGQAKAIRGEVTLTPRGFVTVESSSDVASMAILLEHAMSVSDCVREGPRAPGTQPTPITVGETLPSPEVSIGGVPHRFLLTQPDAGQLGRLKEQGVQVVVNFRHAREHVDYNERTAAVDAGMEYCNLPYMGVSELSDSVIDSARKALADADTKRQAAALHCRTGNRVGPAWAAYRVLDQKVPLQQAIHEAKAMQMLDPMMESATREYIRRHGAAGDVAAAWTLASVHELNPSQKVQYQAATQARDVMVSRLLEALSKAMSSEQGSAGVAAAIGVCKDQAPRIAQSVAAERGVMIGRTGTRLRSPSNAAPRWASDVLSQLPADPQVFSNPDGSLGVTLPIRVAATCLACHGDASHIDRVVAEAIAAKYPKDQATGYKEGDLRGWFWVEVPASQ